MKKFLLTLSVIFLFAVYSVFQKKSSAAPVIAPQSPQPSLNVPPTSTTSNNTVVPTSVPNNTPEPTSGMAMGNMSGGKMMGAYRDGTYNGNTTDAFYGYVQVQVSISNGKITTVNFLQYPNDRSTSVYINSQAMPYLKQEAIAAQSSNVNIVSGATATSQAFITSLASALAQAK